jgi:hypothetical protein
MNEFEKFREEQTLEEEKKEHALPVDAKLMSRLKEMFPRKLLVEMKVVYCGLQRRCLCPI